MALRGSQPAILQSINESPKDSAGYVSDEQIARLTRIAIEDVKEWLITLEDDRLVSIARRTDGFWAVMEAKGQIEWKRHLENLKYRTGNATAVAEEGQPKIRPKGFRAFDSEDADFFLGPAARPYDRDGLPDRSISGRFGSRATIRTTPSGSA